VNGETRALVKRSSRAGDLKEKFKTAEMSLISTLEVAWENKSLWPDWYERHFCIQVAKTNKLELLMWAREEKKCEWSAGTINRAAIQGNLEMIKYCVANECPIDKNTCAFENGHLHILEYLVQRKFDQYSGFACGYAAKYGHLDCLKYLHGTAKVPLNDFAVREAHENKHTECLQYLLDNNCPLPSGWRYERGELHSS
jgi:hypothetical protein